MTKDLNVKIGDLGVSKMLNHSGSFTKTLIGTPYYLSPELCEEKPYNDKNDVLALGCILYELCTFRHPFKEKSQVALIIKILKGTYDPKGNNYSSDLKNLVNSLFEKDAKKRPFVSNFKESKWMDESQRKKKYSKGRIINLV